VEEHLPGMYKVLGSIQYPPLTKEAPKYNAKVLYVNWTQEGYGLSYGEDPWCQENFYSGRSYSIVALDQYYILNKVSLNTHETCLYINQLTNVNRGL
jgi:hypothetical protein